MKLNKEGSRARINYINASPGVSASGSLPAVVIDPAQRPVAAIGAGKAARAVAVRPNIGAVVAQGEGTRVKLAKRFQDVVEQVQEEENVAQNRDYNPTHNPCDGAGHVARGGL